MKKLEFYRDKSNLKFSPSVLAKMIKENHVDFEFLSRVDNDPALFQLSLRLSKELKFDAKTSVLSRSDQGYSLDILTEPQVNSGIGTHNVFGVDLTKIPTTRKGTLERESYVRGLNYFIDVGVKKEGSSFDPVAAQVRREISTVRSLPTESEIFEEIARVRSGARMADAPQAPLQKADTPLEREGDTN